MPPESELVRIEHWQIAVDHAAQLARHWTHPEAPRMSTVPYFWSDQYGKKIQMLGHPEPSDDVVLVAGSLDEGRWLALYSRGAAVTGVVALNQPRGLMLAKVALDSPTTLDEALEPRPLVDLERDRGELGDRRLGSLDVLRPRRA